MIKLVITIVVALWSQTIFALPDLPHYAGESHLGVSSCASSTCHGSIQPREATKVLQNEYVVWRDKDVNDGLHTDRDERISSTIVVLWESDLDFDSDGNGDAKDDWITPSGADRIRVAASWEDVGIKSVRVSVCDGMGVCVYKDTEVTVLAEKVAEPSLSDFSLQDWQEWLVDASGESFLVLALIVAVLILGWAVMRSPTEIEEEAEQAAQTYEVEEVQSFGGVLGLDQHKPPPAPKILSKDERRSDSSGYVRPLRRRR